MSTQSLPATPYGALHVADVAERAGVTPATVRYYARIQLISPKRDPENNYRCFSLPDVRRLEFIRQAQALGLTIGDIKSILDAVDEGETPCDQVKSLVKRRLDSVRRQITELHATEARMTEVVNTWQTMGAPQPLEGEYCPLIDRVEVENYGRPDAARRQTRRNRDSTSIHCPRPSESSRLALSG
ncbi:MAG: MerR family DNA-binding protein [Wenzhouxiangellaceae bacterium]